MVVHENFLKFSQNFFCVKYSKKVFIDKHDKTIHEPVRSECSSCMVLMTVFGVFFLDFTGSCAGFILVVSRSNTFFLKLFITYGPVRSECSSYRVFKCVGSSWFY